MRLQAGIAGLVMLSAVAAAQEEVTLPDPGAPEGAVATARSERPLDTYDLPINPYQPGGAGARTVTGRVLWSAFRLNASDATTAEVMEGYRRRLAGLGFEPILDCATQGCGGFDFRFAVQLLPAPAMLMDTADFAQFSAAKGPDGEQTFVSVLVSRLLGTIHIQTVVVAPAEGTIEVSASPAPEGGSAPVVLPRDEAELLGQLRADGHVPVGGLNFQTGGAELAEDSRPALDALAQILTENPDLAVAIVGHSDNQGALEANIALSKRRAETVRDALVERGVEAGRLDAHGVGFLAPVTTNATPEGRTINRRVELVLR